MRTTENTPLLSGSKELDSLFALATPLEYFEALEQVADLLLDSPDIDVHTTPSPIYRFQMVKELFYRLGKAQLGIG